MGKATGIGWTGSTWTPIRARNRETGKVGWFCTHASEGCRNCYAERQNVWTGTGLRYEPKNLKRLDMFLDEKILRWPTLPSWKEPRRVFVCSMTDLFADFVDMHWIDRMFAMMLDASQHTFQILTKRPERMMEYMTEKSTPARIGGWFKGNHRAWVPGIQLSTWPLQNVWCGVSAEDQATADERIPLLLQTPAAIRWVSYEPALGPVDFSKWLWYGLPAHRLATTMGPRLDWVVVGGES